MRRGLLVALGLAGGPAVAEPRLEASGFVGVGHFGDDIELGDSYAPEQVPGTAPVLGARLHVLLAPTLARPADLRLQLGIEAEVAITTAFTGGELGDGGRGSYFAPVLGWRAHGLLRLAGPRTARPHLVGGIGGATVASASPYMRKETDPVFYWGPGISLPVAGGWSVRIDARHGVMAARDGVTSTFEVQFGVAGTFSLPSREIPAPPVERPPVQPEIDDADEDEDGLPDRLDACPGEPETVNGLADDDGCAEADADGDGLTGDLDRCPMQAEDFDRFEDEDGCPELDNDGDGLEDVRDTCPAEPEIRNGFDDEDGCPDGVPAEITQLLTATASVGFGHKSARVTERAQQLLAPVHALLAERRQLRIAVIGRPGDDAIKLAQRRADAVKWHLVDLGIAEDRIETSVGPKQPVPGVELVLLPPR